MLSISGSRPSRAMVGESRWCQRHVSGFAPGATSTCQQNRGSFIPTSSTLVRLRFLRSESPQCNVSSGRGDCKARRSRTARSCLTGEASPSPGSEYRLVTSSRLGSAQDQPADLARVSRMGTSGSNVANCVVGRLVGMTSRFTECLRSRHRGTVARGRRVDQRHCLARTVAAARHQSSGARRRNLPAGSCDVSAPSKTIADTRPADWMAHRVRRSESLPMWPLAREETSPSRRIAMAKQSPADQKSIINSISFRRSSLPSQLNRTAITSTGAVSVSHSDQP